MKKNRIGRTGPGKIILIIIMAFLLLVSFYPIFWMFTGTFKTNKEVYRNPLSLPTNFGFDSYKEAWKKADLGIAFRNSILITVVSVFLIVFISSLAAYALAQMQFKMKETLYLFILAGQIISAQIILIPLFTMLRNMKVLNTVWAAIFAYTAVGIPITVLLLRNSFLEIPRELYESAKIDGCGSFRFYWQLLLPLSKPGLASVIIYQTVFAWNEYIFALTFLQQNSARTLPLAMTAFVGRYSSDWPKIFAVLTLSMLPMLILYMFVQRYFITGLTAGAVKG